MLRLKRATRVRNTFTLINKKKRRKENQSRAKNTSQCHISQIRWEWIKCMFNIFFIDYHVLYDRWGRVTPSTVSVCLSVCLSTAIHSLHYASAAVTSSWVSHHRSDCSRPSHGVNANVSTYPEYHRTCHYTGTYRRHHTTVILQQLHQLPIQSRIDCN